MSKRLFDYDPMTGIKKFWHYDESNDKAIIETEQDSTLILEANKMERNSHDGKYGDGMHKVASIPMTMYWQWKKEGLFEPGSESKLMARLRDPSYCHLLTVQKV